MEIVYVCDRKKTCAEICLRSNDYCTHTTDVTHALYDEHVDFERYGDIMWEVLRPDTAPPVPDPERPGPGPARGKHLYTRRKFEEWLPWKKLGGRK